MKSLLAIALLLVLTAAGGCGKQSSDNSSVNGGGGSGRGDGGGGDGSSVNQYEFVFTDGMLYIYSIDTLSSTPVKKVSIPTAAGTRDRKSVVEGKSVNL